MLPSGHVVLEGGDLFLPNFIVQVCHILHEFLLKESYLLSCNPLYEFPPFLGIFGYTTSLFRQTTACYLGFPRFRLRPIHATLSNFRVLPTSIVTVKFILSKIVKLSSESRMCLFRCS